jgi:PIN domain nuclease of toxin-antitoxin system
MNLLVDSHALLWWLGATDKLSSTARDALKSPVNRVYVSAAVAWELAIKVNLGKLDAGGLVADLPRVLFEKGFRRLAVSMEHALRAGALPRHHRDPFDRMLVAQAQALGFAIVSADAEFDRYGVARIW